MLRTFFLVLLLAGTLLRAALPATLTPEVAEQASAYMEWLLDISFMPEQKGRYHEILSETFRGRNQNAVDGVVAMARAEEKLRAMTEEKRNELRSKMQGEFVGMLRKATADLDSQWLLGLFESRNSVGSPAAADARSVRPLTGRWTAGRVSTIQYQNAYTGVAAPTNGSSFAYEFRPDGTYGYTGLMQSVMYNCTTAVFSNETGTYSISGDTVALHPEKNPYRMTNSCSPSSNHESPGKVIARSYRFRMTQEGGRTKIELTGSDGAAQTFAGER